jgi:toxin-antitoxin system PIN domain toxin
MLLADVNILVSAFRADAPGHAACRDIMLAMTNGPLPYAVSDLVLSRFLRVVTHPRVFDPPAAIAEAMSFANAYRHQPNATRISPGPRHWQIFMSLCESGGARGNLVWDAYLAALALESGSEWLTADRDFGRFPGLRWKLVELR